MEPKMGSVFLAIQVLILSQCAESFFFPQFLRRQTFSGGGPPLPPQFPPRPQGQGRGDVPNGFQMFKRPRAANTLTEGTVDSNFQVPDSLCLACGNFPWTPVAGKEQIVGSVSGVPSSSAPHPVTAGKPDNSNKPPQQQQQQQESFNFQEYPVHQHLQVTKEPGNTVVINALSPDIQEGSRRPYAFAFGSPPANGIKPSTNQRPSQEQAKNSQQFGSQIMIPYEKSKGQGSVQMSDTPRQPSASSLNPGYAKPPQIPNKPDSFQVNQGPAPGLYGSNSLPLNRLPSQHFPGKSNFSPTHPQNLGPITVGTILAAQQNYQIQPARLVYQDHTSIHQPQYMVPVPQRPSTQMYAPAQASSPQSFKLPILTSNAGPSGTVTLNQVPLHSVAGYNPNYSPSFVPPGVYAFPVPPPQANQANFQPIQQFASSPVPVIPAQRQPKPGYPTQVFETYENNPYRVPEQQVPEYSSTRYNFDANAQGSQGGAEGTGYAFQFFGDNRPPPQAPPPPATPYAPPKPTPTSLPPVTFHQKESDQPSPTYIPPRVTGSQFTTLVHPSPNQGYHFQLQSNNDLGEEGQSNRDETSGSAPQVTLEYMPSQNSQVELSPVSFSDDQEPIKDYSLSASGNVAASGDAYTRKPITIQNLLKLQQAYRFLDEPAYPPQGQQYAQQYPGHHDQKSTSQGDKLGQASILSQTKTGEVTQKKVEPTVPTTTVNEQPSTQPLPTKESDTKFSKVVDEEMDKKPSPGKYGAYEVVPATQFEITHLFKPQEKHREEKQAKSKVFPVPVPVPISEADLSNSKSPLFVIDPLATNNQEGNSQQQQYEKQQPISSYEEKQNYYANFHRQMYYDPLPPAVVSALQHAQTTSYLTHQHHLVPNVADDMPKENTIYINSVPVTEVDVQYSPPAHGKRILKPIAFDLNSGKQIELQSNRNAEIISLQTVLDADAEAEQRRVIPAYTLQEGSSLRPLFTTSDNQGSADQSEVNCQNNPQWAVPPPSSYGQEIPASSQISQGQELGPIFVENRFAQEEPDANINPRQKVIFYSNPQGSSYWMNQEYFPSMQSPSKGLVYGQEIQKEVEIPPTTTTTTTQATLEYKETAPKTYLAKPVLKWSKIVKPKVKYEETSTTFLSNSNEDVTFSSTEKAGADAQKASIGSSRTQQSDNDEKEESESKDVKTARTQTARSSDGSDKVKYETIVAGPTTIADCVTESTTTETTDYYDATTTSYTTLKPTQTYLPASSQTFSPRIDSRAPEDSKRNRSRFPTGRPTISTIRRTTEETTSVSASFHMPVYKPHESIASILQQTMKSYGINFRPNEEANRKKPEPDSSEDASSTEALAPPPNGFSQPITIEDDEADEIQIQNSLGEMPTGRRVSSYSPFLNSMKVESENKTSSPGIVFSTLISPETQATNGSSPARNTKVVKTVRVRQRMRPAHLPAYFRNLAQQRLKMNSGSSRVRVMTKAGAADYARSHSEAIVPEAELGEDERKEVKEALIEIKRVSNT